MWIYGPAPDQNGLPSAGLNAGYAALWAINCWISVAIEYISPVKQETLTVLNSFKTTVNSPGSLLKL